MAAHEIDNGARGSGTVEPLLQAARNGCPTSLGDLTERCRGYLLHVARRELDPELQGKVAPSDLVQQTLVQVQRKLQGFQGETEEEFQAWLRQILLNQARTATRHFKDTAKRDVRREVTLEAVEADAGPMALTSNIETPSKLAVANERMQGMAVALQRLPSLYRQVIELRSLQSLPFSNIGRQLSRSPDSARALWIRAIERLRTEMQASDQSR